MLRDGLGTAAVDTLLGGDSLFNRSDCKIIKDQRKIKVGRLVLEVASNPTAIFLKQYNAFSWRYKLMSLFSASGAYRSLRGAAMLAQAGIRTGAPLAAIEWRRWGMLERSVFLSREIESAKTADAHWLEELAPIAGLPGIIRRRRFLVRLAELLRQLHANSIYHNDLKDANVLVKPDPDQNEYFFLLDLEGVRRCVYVSNRRRVKNLVQLNRTLGKFLTRTHKLLLLTSYLGGSPKETLRWWVTRLERATMQTDQRSWAKNH